MSVVRSSCLLLLAPLACVTGVLPRDPEPRSQAIGTVHVSTPLFTPLDPFRQDRALDFKGLRDEQYLDARVNQANMSVANVTTRQVEVAGAVAFAGKRPATAAVATDPADAAAAATDPAAVTAPAVPTPEPTLAPDAAAQQQVAALLGSSGARHLLMPDEVATIVASLKLYMVSLEDYYNAGAIYNDALRSHPNWVPYRVHFTVTTDPGWFTQLNAYDAIAEVAIGNPDEVQVLTVIPSQNTQAFEQFSATFKTLATSVSAEGGRNRVAARAAVRALRTAAERLEGLRANTTFTASALAGNKVRLRFRPSLVPGKGQLELQPLSRIVTAVVLVRPESAAPGGSAASLCPASKAPAQGGGSASTGWFAHGIRAATSRADRCLASGQIEISHGAWFEAGPTFTAGSRRAPHVRAPQRTLCNGASTPAACREQLAVVAGYLPRWTPTAVFGAAQLRVDDGMFWRSGKPGVVLAAVPFELRVPAPEEGFTLSVQGPGVLGCAASWAALAEAGPEPCTGACDASSRASFQVYNPRASTFVCSLDEQVIGAAEQVPIYVVAASNSVAMHGTGVDFSSVFATAVLHRAAAAAPVAAPGRLSPIAKPRRR
ncbi:MAG: hypothetical protein IPO88_11005 [Nannocystis sp.]|uniref:hypothetical protein n=1 Tax=Nannocystis sp. TaxID=1962667 RepID=UPI00242990A7|nr:hypothetical protein [Nannocystis sp.]MBK9754015.1 hypothetical protein [Nannocystis sp.]